MGNQCDFKDCWELLRLNSTTGRMFNNRTGSAFFNCIHQVWMDDPETLMIKYDLANSFYLRGIGMWEADSVDCSVNTSSEVKQDTRDMWEAMRRFPMKTYDV